MFRVGNFSKYLLYFYIAWTYTFFLLYNKLFIRQPHEVSPEYLKGRAARNAAAVTDKTNKPASKDVKKKSITVSMADVAKVSKTVFLFI